jgi:hypothetical protein
MVDEKDDKIVTDAPSLDTPINCEICSWYGRLREATHEKSYSHTSINHNYTCPKCGADIYHWTEDKPLDADQASGGPTHHVSPPSSPGIN